MIAAVADVGRPSVSIGTRTPAAEALLAASGPATPSDRAFAEFLRFRRELLLDVVAQKGRDLGAARGHGPDGKTDGGAAQPWFPRPLPFLERHPERARERDDLVLAEAVARGDVERFPDRDQTDRDRKTTRLNSSHLGS